MKNEFNIQSTNAYNCGRTSAIVAQLSKYLLTRTVIYMGDTKMNQTYLLT